jgi:hypothetical protein
MRRAPKLTERTAMRKFILWSADGAPTSFHPSGTRRRCSTGSPSSGITKEVLAPLTPAMASRPVKKAYFMVCRVDGKCCEEQGMDEVCSYIQDSVLCNRSTLLSQSYRGRRTSGLERMSYGVEQVIKYLAGCSKAVATGSSWACISMINKTPQMEKAHVRGVFHLGPGSACYMQGHQI